MKKIIKAIGLAVIVCALSLSTTYAEKGGGKGSDKSSDKKKENLVVTGTINAIDPTSKTITVNSSKFIIANDTILKIDGVSALLESVQVGMNATVTPKSGSKGTAQTVDVTTSAGKGSTKKGDKSGGGKEKGGKGK